MSTDSLIDSQKPAAEKAKSSFWTLRRAPKDDVAEHPPFVATLPHVNLLPAAIKDAISAAKLRRWFILGGLLLLAIVAGIWYLQSSQISKAQDALAQAQAENTELQASMGDLTGVKEMYGQITRLQNLVTTTTASQPEAALVITQLIAAGAAAKEGGTGVTFGTVNIGYTGIPNDPGKVTQCPNPDPFAAEPTIGCVTFTANAISRDQVSELLRLLEADPLFAGPFVTSTSLTPGDAAAGTKDSVAFAGTVGVALDGLTTKLSPEQVEAIVNPTASAAPDAAAPSPAGETP